jgi:hypothetical protein
MVERKGTTPSAPPALDMLDYGIDETKDGDVIWAGLWIDPR